MGHRTIPEPTANDFNVAFGAMLVTARSHGLDVNTDEALLATFRQNAEVVAQLRAELRHCHSLLHPEASCAPSSPGPSPQERWEAMADEQHMSKLQDQLDAKWLMENADDDD